MTTFDLSPLFRSSVGFDRLAQLLDGALAEDTRTGSYPPYDIEVVGDDEYRITMAVAGFDAGDLNLEVADNTLTVSGKRPEVGAGRYLHQGIARRNFVHRFSLADHVRVVSANIANGMLTVDLEREIPEALRPRRIEVTTATATAIPAAKTTVVKAANAA